MTSGSQIRRTVGRAALTVATLGKECWIAVRRRMGTPKKGRWTGRGFDRGLRFQGDARTIAGQRVFGVTGKPFNIASYALLTLMLAQVTGLKPGDFVHTLGDAHLYLNHVEQAELQLTRPLRPLPTMQLNPAVTDLFGFTFEDFTLVGYDPHPAIKAPVAV